MDQFERFAQPDLFVEESDIIPVIIKYADFNETRHDEKNDTPFKNAIKSYEGIHSCVFVNDGVSNGRNPRAQFLIILEDVELSIRAQIEGSYRAFFGPTLLAEKLVIPTDESEYIRRRCDVRIVDNFSDEIDIASEMHWGNRLAELKSFIQSVASLKRPLKEIRKKEDQEIWSSYAEGLEALTKAKQELRRISKIGEIHTEKNRRKENVNVIDLEIYSIHCRSLLSYRFTMALKRQVSMQAPHLMHLRVSIWWGFLTSPEIALTGQARAQAVQPLHLSSSMT